MTELTNKLQQRIQELEEQVRILQTRLNAGPERGAATAALSERPSSQAAAIQVAGIPLESILDSANVWLEMLNDNAQVVIWNRAAEKICGYTRENAVGNDKIWEWLYPDEDYRKTIMAMTAAVIAGEPIKDVETTIQCNNGATKILCWYSHPVNDADGKPSGSLALKLDITARKQAEQALRSSEQRRSQALEAARAGAWEWDIDTNQTVWSAQNYLLLGLPPDSCEPSYANWLDRVHPADRAAVQAQIRQALADRSELHLEFRVVWPDGSIHWISSVAQIVYDESGKAVRMYGIQLDISARKQVEAALFEEKERAQVTLHSIGDAVIVTDAAGIVQYLNPVAEALTGWSLSEARGRPLQQVFHIFDEDTRQPAPDPVARCLREGKIVGLANHTCLLSRLGSEYAIQDSAAPIRGPDGGVLGAVLVFSDVTLARQLTQAMSYQATHDGLTGLINRQEFERRLQRVLETAQVENTDNAFGYLDLDQFKIVNDTCGHVAGDELLRQFSHLLQSRLRKRDTLARLGGDEFGILMEHCSVQHALRVAEMLRQAIEDFRFFWQDKVFNIGVSIGLVAVNQASQNPAEVINAADAACYMAKAQGRNRIHVYQIDDAEMVRRQNQIQWAVRLPRALEEGRLRLWWQPIVPLGRDDTEGDRYELLLRLEDEAGRLVPPGAFLPAAERYNLATRLDRWVLGAALEWLMQHPHQLQQLAFCTINLSGHSLSETAFLSFVLEQLETTGIPPAKLCFEISETVAIANLTNAARFIKALKARGCLFALDDFGSGLCSFAYLKNLPVDYLKIDGTFVRGIATEPANCAIVKAIHDIGRVMGKQTIAEFVEDSQILDKLREIGVDYTQGYYIGRPQPLQPIES